MRAVVYGHLSPKLTPQTAEAVLMFKKSQDEHLGLSSVGAAMDKNPTQSQ